MAELEQARRPFALATVVRTQGSTPQVVGAKLVVTDDDSRGRAAGTLGGGCVEADAILAARQVLRDGGRTLRAYELTEQLAWNTGLVCGGTMWILAERGEDALSASGRSVLPDLVRASAGGPPLAIATLLRKQGRTIDFAGRVFVDVEGAAMAGGLGMATGPVTGGLIYDTFGSYSWLFIVSFALGIGAFLIALTFRPYGDKPAVPAPA